MLFTGSPKSDATATITGIGTAGTGPGSTPTNGSGMTGWLRGIYDRLVAGVSVTGTVEITNDIGNAIPVNGSVSAAVTGTVSVSDFPADYPSTAAITQLTDANTTLTAIDTDLNTGVGDGGFQDPVTGSGILGYLASVYNYLLSNIHTNPQGSIYVSQKYGTVDSSVGAGNTDTGTPRVVIATNQGAVAVSSATLATASGQTTANSSLSTLVTNTTSIATSALQTSANTKLDTLSTNLTTIDGHVDGLETLVGTTNTSLTTLHTDLGHLTDGTQQNQIIASATNGYTLAKTISAATTNATSLKGSAGTVGFIIAANVATTPRYLKIYNKATAPTVGTDVPVLVAIIPGSTTVGAGSNIPIPTQGLNLGTGIAFAITAGITDADTTAVGLSEVAVTIGYK